MSYNYQNDSRTRRYRRLTVNEWVYAVDQYELGRMNGSALARHFDMSKQAISSGLVKRGAIKACRVNETVADLHAALDRRDQALVLHEARLMQACSDRTDNLIQMVDGLVFQAGFTYAELNAF
jgi:hypothetical protein